MASNAYASLLWQASFTAVNGLPHGISAFNSSAPSALVSLGRSEFVTAYSNALAPSLYSANVPSPSASSTVIPGSPQTKYLSLMNWSKMCGGTVFQSSAYIAGCGIFACLCTKQSIIVQTSFSGSPEFPPILSLFLLRLVYSFFHISQLILYLILQGPLHVVGYRDAILNCKMYGTIPQSVLCRYVDSVPFTENPGKPWIGIRLLRESLHVLVVVVRLFGYRDA
ncbi:hypothetical protein BDV33DRAFT_208899 [Aspergillus novoparasiticus]|uniref:Uncharacterized protein n=1 Tax=Aspergillus novoparasiticus TaxID=986946 RepID=A0A5N6EBW8_9EURO|nr:hypothetical protein BDV33DRAFT_208899 [Aspergillus novoparasiticus]